jgi:hypothetical protein
VTSVDATIAALKAFVPTGDGKDVAGLYEILEGFGSLPGRDRAIRAMFQLMERFPDADLGAPGPLVHEIEAIDGYQLLLRESLHRRPTEHTLGMVNRILNSRLSEEDRRSWMKELFAVAHHPDAPVSARQAAQFFIDHQKGRAGAV